MLVLRDPVSSSTHLATAIWAVFATLLLLRLTPAGQGRRWAVLVYGGSMVMLFLASGMFHALYFSSPEERRFFQKIDMSAVYVLIAGTNTPAITILLRGGWRWWSLRLVWTCALVGVACQWLLPTPAYSLVVGLYVGLGWLGFAPVVKYYQAVGWRAMNWLWLGAAFHVLGAVCELTQWPVIIPGWVQPHEVLHVCHMVATMAFFIFAVRYVIPFPTTTPEGDDRVAELTNPAAE